MRGKIHLGHRAWRGRQAGWGRSSLFAERGKHDVIVKQTVTQNCITLNGVC